MHRERTVEERLEAVERALTDEDLSVAAATDEAARETRLREVETRLDAVEASLDDLEAAVAALRGYVGEIRHVNEEVERTATAAVAAVERLDAASGAPPPIARVDPSASGHSESGESASGHSESGESASGHSESGESASTGFETDVSGGPPPEGTDETTDGTDESIVDRLRSYL